MAKRKKLSEAFEFDDDGDDIEKEWDERNMPEFNQPDNGAFRQIIVSFDDQAGVNAFAKAIKQTLTDKTKSIWYPPRPTNRVADLFWFDDEHPPEDGEEENGPT